MAHLSVVGCGNMGGALLKGLAQSGNHRLVGCDVDEHARAAVAECCVETTDDLAVAGQAEYVVLALKPDVVTDILSALDLNSNQTVISIAAGVSTDHLATVTDASIVRLMPNLAAETTNMAAAVTGAVDDTTRALLDDLGEFAEIKEPQMDIATAVNGSGPAFIFYLIGAMKRAGVNSGLDDTQAETLAAQTAKGAAETVLQSEQSIDELIDSVCSPGGTTIEGMRQLWESTAESDLITAVHAAEDRSREMAAEVTDE
ncbi:MAG: pyrroline-5-carboxylate reductase [halophilic archaeon J07HX5]|jgi:pyrroline-5-carboxylate reductase (EC 1.5.1.2)|nr:MAG: pyrroline-5-carboxylate reductase [halophilic archaeon J07HX5]